MSSPLDTYLAWQADIGTEDVVLVQPWARPRTTPAQGGNTQNRESLPYEPGSPNPNQGVSRRSPEDHRGTETSTRNSSARSFEKFSPAAGADFFSSIAEALAKPDPFVRKGGTPAPAASKPTVSPAPFLPEFQDLDAYWAFLEASCPIWFPGTAGALARAEGPTRPTLAVVELAPQSERVFAGESGEFLDKMMKGIGLEREHLYLTSVMKTPPTGKTWARKDIARMVPAVLQELNLAGAGLVLLLGEACAQGVLRSGKSLTALAETAESHGNMTLVATEHPAVLMHADDAARRAAWNQLKWLRARLPSRNS